MKLQEKDACLTPLCRSLEQRTSSVLVLSSSQIPVALKADFRNEPEATKYPSIAKNPALYRKSAKTIFVNAEVFFMKSASVQEATLAHEVGHLFCDLSPCPEVGVDGIGECGMADLLACRWGYLDELKVDRMPCYGKEYCDILDSWNNQEEFLERMKVWHYRKQAGLIKPCSR